VLGPTVAREFTGDAIGYAGIERFETDTLCTVVIPAGIGSFDLGLPQPRCQGGTRHVALGRRNSDGANICLRSFGFELQGRCSAFTSWRARIRYTQTLAFPAHE
jgi:hypothetical protein